MENISKLFENTTLMFKTFQTKQNESKSDFLDPLSVIITLSVLKYKPVGTKLKINNNSITIHEPTIIQGLYRSMTGESKCDLKLLYEPIINVCKCFLINVECLTKSTYLKIRDKQNEFHKNEHIRQIFELAILGLKNLLQTYKDANDIVVLLNMYTNIIDRCLSDDSTTLLHDLEMISHPKYLIMGDEVDNMLKMKQNMYVQFNNLWTMNKINMYVTLFNELEIKTEVDKQNVFKSINLLLEDVHRDVRSLLNNFQRI